MESRVGQKQRRFPKSLGLFLVSMQQQQQPLLLFSQQRYDEKPEKTLSYISMAVLASQDAVARAWRKRKRQRKILCYFCPRPCLSAPAKEGGGGDTRARANLKLLIHIWPLGPMLLFSLRLWRRTDQSGDMETLPTLL